MSDPETTRRMETVRKAFHDTARSIVTLCPQDRYRSLAMTDLEASLLRALQSIATEDPTTKRVPNEG